MTERKRPSRYYVDHLPLAGADVMHERIVGYYRRLVAYYVWRCRWWQRACSRLVARIERLERRER